MGLHTTCSCSFRLCIKILLSAVVVHSLLTCTSALECSVGSTISSGRTSLTTDALCVTDGACFVKISQSAHGKRVSQGCLSKDNSLRLCSSATSRSTRSTLCCYHDHCNTLKEVEKTTPQQAAEKDRGKRMIDTSTMDETMATTTSGDHSTLKTAAIWTAAVCLIAMTVIIALVATISVCCCYRHGNYRHHQERRRRRRQGDEEIGQSDSRISFASSECCEAIIPSGETLSNLLQSAHHHSSSPSLLVQRSVARHTMLVRTLEQGQFCEVHEGRWRNDRVMVKIYPSKHERLWFAETEIYQISHIPHPNILNFIAAEIIQKNSQTFHHLICEYHERGTLFDYLKTTLLDVHGLLVLSESIAAGLSHLHSDHHDNQGVVVKAAIAHCNLTSKSVYVKTDGSCCIADLSLAVKNDRNVQSQLRGRPVKINPRYMAPELLEGQEIESLDFASLRKVDMYSFSLVLWEIARKCLIQGSVEEAALPYSDVVPSDQPTVEQMRDLVCVQERRPPLADQWSSDESMGMVVRMIKECWHPKSEVRLTALRVKKTLHKLSDSVRPLLDKNGKVSSEYKFDRKKFQS